MTEQAVENTYWKPIRTKGDLMKFLEPFDNNIKIRFHESSIVVAAYEPNDVGIDEAVINLAVELDHGR
jgi:hypothetical protein